MAILREYYRPATIDEAIALLARRDRRLLPLAGGTNLIGRLETGALRDIDGLVDLQGLGLESIHREGDLLHVGAMATLSALIQDENAGALANGLLRRAAQGEGPVNFRNAATTGGLVALAAYDSEFYTALLALDASVVLYDGQHTRTVPLAQLGPVGGLVIEVQIPLAERRGGAARVARTPSDRPIVAAYAAIGEAGERVALCGVGLRPLLFGETLEPPSNFKGSALYRRAMAEVVMARALAEARG